MASSSEMIGRWRSVGEGRAGHPLLGDLVVVVDAGQVMYEDAAVRLHIKDSRRYSGRSR